MNRDSINWKGYIPAITTPFHSNGDIDWKGFEDLLNWLMDEGMHGIIVNGTTGEWFSQSVEEQGEIFQFAARIIDGKIPLLGGCTAFTADQSIEIAKLAGEAHLDGILIAPPPYIAPNDDELVSFYEHISNHVQLPICVYNWPRGTNVDMQKDLVKRLAQIDKVVAIKNSTINLQNFVSTFFEVKDDIRYFGFPMNELGVTLIKEHGGDGTMGSGAVLGSVHPNFYNAIWEGEYELALQYGRKDQFLFQSWYNPDFSPKYGSQQAIAKSALNLKGLPGGYPRLPLLPLTEEDVAKVKKTLEEVEVL